jgi:hypothetical protein
MHRASSPGPTVPRKHHKGENPHETSPVIGTSLHLGGTWFETSAFGAKELTPQDSRLYPHPSAPTSVAARVRQDVARMLEVQVSAERLRDQGTVDGVVQSDEWQASASAYAYGTIGGFRVDALLDGAYVRPDEGQNARALLGEVAVRDPSLRETAWARTEINEREEPDRIQTGAGGSVVIRNGGVSSPWFFETLGFEHVFATSGGLRAGVFAEATYAHFPFELTTLYGRAEGVTINVGLHVFGMWMLDGDLRPMHH